LRRLRLEAARRRPWHELPEDPENEQRRHEAATKMGFFDRLGPAAREAARDSRFDALDVDRLRRRYGGGADYSEPRVDASVAGDVKRDDDFHSGSFGPAYARGI
jgi:hypothetical protein